MNVSIETRMFENLEGAIATQVASTTDPLWASTNGKVTPVSYTATDVFTKLKTVDGAGSGLDVDSFNGASMSGILRFRGLLNNVVTLDSLVTLGIWEQTSDANVTNPTPLNYPINRAGVLTVKCSADSVFVYQEYQTYENNYTFQRTRYTGTWYPWKRIIDSNVPRFSAHGPGSGAGSVNSKLPYTRINTGNMYNPATGIVTFQQAGIYNIHYSGLSQGGPAHMYFLKNGSGVTYTHNSSAAYTMNLMTWCGPMAVGDTCYAWTPSGYTEYTGGDTSGSYQRFWGTLIG